MNARVMRGGFLTTVQDLGRSGFRQSGVPIGGALDPHALRIANLLVGNDELAAALEIAFGGLRLTLSDDRILAWCGGDFETRVGPNSIPAGHPFLSCGGEELIIDRPKSGCRAWLAISGGIDVPLVLGSRSTDLRGNFGGFEGRTLHDGDEIPLGQNTERANRLIEKLRAEKVAHWKPPHDWSSPTQSEPVLRFVRGVDWSRFSDVTLQRFTTEAFAVLPDSDRMGVRFDAPPLTRKENVDLISEAVLPGTLQVPPSGKPILLLGDCQTIGGYPKIAHVITVDLPIAAQLRAGDAVHFREVSLADAHRLWVERECHLAQFRRGLETRFA
jgi:antagonist of KipI